MESPYILPAACLSCPAIADWGCAWMSSPDSPPDPARQRFGSTVFASFVSGAAMGLGLLALFGAASTAQLAHTDSRNPPPLARIHHRQW